MKYLKYSDVALVPHYSTIDSRSYIDTSVTIKSKKFKLPIIPANMKCVIDSHLAKWLSANGYFYIMHRFNIDIFEFVKTANEENWDNISISIGVKDGDYKLVQKIYEEKLRVDYITVDIAHGHSLLTCKMLYWIKQYLPNVTIIAGNVATYEGVKCLTTWGADIVKVGIGQGAACTTKDKTGFTMPMFTCINKISKDLKTGDKLPLIIADGGIHSNGDIAKALVAGADLVMAGGMFAQCIDSPAENINGAKVYFGSASAENKGHSNNIEGKVALMENNKMSYVDKLKEIEQDLQSAVSYAGGTNLNALKTVEWIEV